MLRLLLAPADINYSINQSDQTLFSEIYDLSVLRILRTQLDKECKVPVFLHQSMQSICINTPYLKHEIIESR